MRQPVSGEDEVAKKLVAHPVLRPEHVAELRAHELLRTGDAVHVRHGVVALRDVGMRIERPDLLLFGKQDGDGMVQLKSPDPLGALFDKLAITLFPDTERFFPRSEE